MIYHITDHRFTSSADSLSVFLRFQRYITRQSASAIQVELQFLIVRKLKDSDDKNRR